jgi:hypothetical protein
MMTFTRESKQKAIDVGFVSVGVSNPNMLRCCLTDGYTQDITCVRQKRNCQTLNQ